MSLPAYLLTASACDEPGERSWGSVFLGKGSRLTANIIMPLYKRMVLLHLHCCVQFWWPHLKTNYVELEKLQKSATMIRMLDPLLYEERLQCVECCTL